MPEVIGQNRPVFVALAVATVRTSRVDWRLLRNVGGLADMAGLLESACTIPAC